MSTPERIPGIESDIDQLKVSVSPDGTVVLEEASFPDWFSPQQRNEAKADLMEKISKIVGPKLEAKGLKARLVWHSELE